MVRRLASSRNSRLFPILLGQPFPEWNQVRGALRMPALPRVFRFLISSADNGELVRLNSPSFLVRSAANPPSELSSSVLLTERFSSLMFWSRSKAFSIFGLNQLMVALP